jgi:hypothetical protein
MITEIIINNSDIIIGNLLFWPIYIWVCTIPYRMLQMAIDNA